MHFGVQPVYVPMLYLNVVAAPAAAAAAPPVTFHVSVVLIFGGTRNSLTSLGHSLHAASSSALGEG